MAGRISIQDLVQAKLSGREIASKLNDSRSTLHREITHAKAQTTVLAIDDQAGTAQLSAQARRWAGTEEPKPR